VLKQLAGMEKSRISIPACSINKDNHHNDQSLSSPERPATNLSTLANVYQAVLTTPLPGCLAAGQTATPGTPPTNSD
ncbi:hypothetical protein Q4595_22550, partial [Wenyingzhuangia sp. 1_MG-2023]|nr:hypothetical protein [Wenyingzhuangia sp. 1_MG-2023]